MTGRVDVLPCRYCWVAVLLLAATTGLALPTGAQAANLREFVQDKRAGPLRTTVSATSNVLPDSGVAATDRGYVRLINRLPWTMVSAQGVFSSIQGKVTDETGGVLPGVTITATSPALQVQQVVEVTDVSGEYRFDDLIPGVYRITYELAGFQTVIKENVRLNAGFAARIDTVMNLGAVKESVIVSGQSPVVDVSTTASSTNFTNETLAGAAVVRTMWQLLAMTPGVRVTSRPDVGGNTVGTQQGYTNYGTSGQVKPELEGVDTRESNNSAGAYYDDRSFDEVQVRPVGNDAEMALPGTNFVAIVKSGGNDFHGSATAAGEWPRLQSNNIDEKLRAQGVTWGNPLKYYWDLSADLGGRIVRDKLWFYAAYRNHRGVVTKIGYAKSPGPDGVYWTADDIPSEDETTITSETIKVSYQPTKRYRLIGFFSDNLKRQPERDGSKFRPAENSYDFWWRPITAKLELQGTLSDRVLVDFLGGGWWYSCPYNAQPYALKAGNPTRYNRYTGLYTGPNENARVRLDQRLMGTGSVSYYPEAFLGGNHSFKAGFRIVEERYGERRPSRPSGNYMLIYDRVGGVIQPVEITTYNLPVSGFADFMSEYSGFVKDTWVIGNRFTLNLGLRVERYHSLLEPQTKEQGTFGGSGTFPGLDVALWTGVAPRVGIAVDLTGNGKTVFKSTWGTYNHVMGDQFADPYNQNMMISTTYRWRDLDGNNDYTPGEVNLSPSGPDFLSVSGATNSIFNPDVKQPNTHEFSATLDRELMPNFSARALYVFKRVNGLYENVNVLRPYSVYNIPLVRTDPGPDGILGTADDGEKVTIYDYDPAYRGAKFVGDKRMNRSGRQDSYHSFEFTLNKRTSEHWDMLASFLATKTHEWADAIPDSPNDNFNAVRNYWDWSFKASGGYMFPHEIRASVFYQLMSGAAGQRTYVFRSADPAGGPSLKQLSTVTLRLEAYGARRQPTMSVVNLRATKQFTLGGSRRLDVDFDLFNALNANTASSISWVSGPNFGKTSAILPPRIARFGVGFSF